MPYSSARGLSPWFLVALSARTLKRVIETRTDRELQTHPTIIAVAEAACLAAATAGRARDARVSGELMALVHAVPTPEAPATLVASAVHLASACLVARRVGDRSLVHTEAAASFEASREALDGDPRAQVEADRILLDEVEAMWELGRGARDEDPFDPSRLGPPWPLLPPRQERGAPSAPDRGGPGSQARRWRA